ncbi:MAG: hypothetical protein QM757_06875 [Paludibaculum sp.]
MTRRNWKWSTSVGESTRFVVLIDSSLAGFFWPAPCSGIAFRSASDFT